MPFYLKVMLGTETSGDSSEQALDVVKACEGDARCHWPFHKVHGQTLVKTPHHPLLSAIFSICSCRCLGNFMPHQTQDEG